MLTEDYAKRRDTTRYYQEDSYKRFLRRSILERSGAVTPAIQQQIPPMSQGENIPFGNQFPTLNQAATLLDDGTISISAPNHFGLNNNTNRQIVLDNQLEQHFAENRKKFLESIYNQEGSTNNGTQ